MFNYTSIKFNLLQVEDIFGDIHYVSLSHIIELVNLRETNFKIVTTNKTHDIIVSQDVFEELLDRMEIQ